MRDVIAYISIKREGTVATSLLGFIDMNGQVLYASLPDRPGGGGFANGFAAWAPDGRRLAVVRQQANSPAEIWLLELEAAQPYRTSAGGYRLENLFRVLVARPKPPA